MSIWVLELFHTSARTSDATFTKWFFSPPSVQRLVTKGLHRDGCFPVVSCVGDSDRVLPLLGSSGSPRVF